MPRAARGIVLLFLFFGGKAYAEAGSPSLDDLRNEADAALQQTSVAARSRVDVVFKLVDRLVEEERIDEAAVYLDRALAVYPWQLNYQMLYAELLQAQGENEAARSKAELVFEYAENDGLIERAGQLLKKEPIPEFEELRRIDGAGHRVVLVPLQNCDTWLITRVREDLERILDVPVVIQRVESEYPLPARNKLKRYLDRIREGMLEAIDEPAMQSALSAMGLTREDLYEDAGMEALILHMASAIGIDDAGEKLEVMRSTEIQWDASELRDVLELEIQHVKRDNLGYLGITPEDIYARDFNFLYGLARRGVGIMSYARFTAAFNSEAPNQTRLTERTLKQALASVGHVFGVERCNDPLCARAYPNNLAEHDAKSATVCSECRKGFHAALEQARVP